MSQRVSNVALITFVNDLQSYTVVMSSSYGDVYQNYATVGGVTTCSPDFPSLVADGKPMELTVTAMSQDLDSNGIPLPGTIQKVVWYIGDSELVFADSGANQDFNTSTDPKLAGMFKRVKESSTSAYNKLQIHKNLVPYLTQNSFIKAKVTIEKTNTDQATKIVQMPLEIHKATDNSWSCHIYDCFQDPGHTPMILQSKTDQVKLAVQIYNGLNKVLDTGACTPTDYNDFKNSHAIVFQKFQDNGTWGDDLEAQTWLLGDADVPSAAAFRVVVGNTSDKTASLAANGSLCSDFADVKDVSDEFVIIPNPTPENATVYASAPVDVYFLPTVQKADGTAVTGTFYYDFDTFDAHGNIVSYARNVASGTKYTIDKSNFGSHGNLNTYISTNV